MKAKYDFSKAERGKFYRPHAVFLLPVYLDPDVDKFVGELAAEKNMDIQSFINDWLRTNMKLAGSSRR